MKVAFRESDHNGFSLGESRGKRKGQGWLGSESLPDLPLKNGVKNKMECNLGKRKLVDVMGPSGPSLGCGLDRGGMLEMYREVL